MALKLFMDNVLLLPLIGFKRKLLGGCLACCNIEVSELLAYWKAEGIRLQWQDSLELHKY